MAVAWVEGHSVVAHMLDIVVVWALRVSTKALFKGLLSEPVIARTVG